MHCAGIVTDTSISGALHVVVVMVTSIHCTSFAYHRFQVGCPKNSECKTAKVSRDLNPPIESRDNLDSIGGFKSRDTFAVLHFWTTNLKSTVQISVEPYYVVVVTATLTFFLRLSLSSLYLCSCFFHSATCCVLSSSAVVSRVLLFFSVCISASHFFTF